MTRILIAEDEPDIRELVNFTLQFAGFEVIVATNGAELAEKAPQVKPDLIVSDVRMPRMTGYEACKMLKENPDTANIPFVFLSAKGQEDEVRAGMVSGAVAYILKPFAPDELVYQVKQIIAKLASGELSANPPPPPPKKPATGPLHLPARPPSRDGTKPLNPAMLPPLPFEMIVPGEDEEA